MKKTSLFLVLFILTAYRMYAARPTVQASSFTYNNLKCNGLTLNWTSGNGSARLIVAREGSAPTYTPVDGTVYSGNPGFGLSTEYPATGDGNFIVYNASGTNFVNISNLSPGKTYYFVIYEHDNNGGSTQYLTDAAPSLSVTTYTISYSYKYRYLDSCEMTNRVEFINTSTSTIPGLAYKFDFGDGVSFEDTVMHHFSSPGLKNVTLSAVTSISGCPAPINKTLKIFPKKMATITFKSQDTQCLEGNYFELQASPIVGPWSFSKTFRWMFGDGDSSTFILMKKTYASSGTYNVMLEIAAVSDSKPTGCKDTLYVSLTVLPSPVGSINLSDTFQCLTGNSFEFENPDNTLSYFKWYFGDGDSSDQKKVSHSFRDTGTYDVIHVAFTNAGCKGRDTVQVRVLPDLDSRFSGLDTFYCESPLADVLQPLRSGGYWEGYPMAGDSMIPLLTGSHSLSYILRDRYCSDTSTLAFRIAPRPRPDIGRDTAVCNAAFYTLNANTAGSYLWSTGETTASINVSNSGFYLVDVSLGKCSASDSIRITFSTPPQIDLGNDTMLCKGGGIWLRAAYPQSTYLWDNGSTDSVRYASQPGKYMVTVSNPCGTVVDSMFLNFQGDYCDLFMANAFSPGNDKVNNEFVPRGINITVRLFQIFNRWGELVFETDQNGKGWDGTFKGEYVPEGLYIWKLFYTTENGPYIKKSNAFGQVLLIR